MKRPLFFALMAYVLCACNTNAPTKQVVVDFDYQRIAPMMVSFTNTSLNCDSYKWDFGDGMWAYGTDAYHEYESTGTYTVTLTATADGERYDRRTQIQIDKPTVYFAGYTLYAIPYENRYYKLSFKDDAWLPSSWDFQTVYTPLLDNTDLPYSVTWNTPQQLVNPEAHEYYKLQVIRTNNTANTSNDVVCMTAKIPVKDILQYPQDLFYETESGNTRVAIHLDYDY